MPTQKLRNRSTTRVCWTEYILGRCSNARADCVQIVRTAFCQTHVIVSSSEVYCFIDGTMLFALEHRFSYRLFSSICCAYFNLCSYLQDMLRRSCYLFGYNLSNLCMHRIYSSNCNLDNCQVYLCSKWKPFLWNLTTHLV